MVLFVDHAVALLCRFPLHDLFILGFASLGRQPWIRPWWTDLINEFRHQYQSLLIKCFHSFNSAFRWAIPTWRTFVPSHSAFPLLTLWEKTCRAWLGRRPPGPGGHLLPGCGPRIHTWPPLLASGTIVPRLPWKRPSLSKQWNKNPTRRINTHKITLQIEPLPVPIASLGLKRHRGKSCKNLTSTACHFPPRSHVLPIPDCEFFYWGRNFVFILFALEVGI